MDSWRQTVEAPNATPTPDTTSATITVADVATASTGSTCSVLTYRVPRDLVTFIRPGTGVVVTVRDRPVVGYVLRLRTIGEEDPLFAKLVDVTDAPPDMAALSEHERQLAEWMAARFVAPLAEAIRVVKGPYAQVRPLRRLVLTDEGRRRLAHVDADSLNQDQRQVLAHLQEHGGSSTMREIEAALKKSTIATAVYALRRSGLIALNAAGVIHDVKPRLVRAVTGCREPTPDGPKRTSAQARVMEVVQEVRPTKETPLPVADLAARAHCSTSVIQGLARAGLLDIETVRVLRRALKRQPHSPSPALTGPQSDAVQAVREELARSAAARKPILLHGITGSGKTEVYLAAIQSALDHNRGAILAVPEISLTAQVVEIVSARFGSRVAVLHSALGKGERYDEWDRVAAGEAVVAVGARSAVFAPVRNLGLIVLDEEHDHAYKQDSAPRYHARDVALERARTSNAVVVLGSATPSLESYHAARTGMYRLAELPARIADRPLPTVHVVDMREAFRAGPCMFAEPLREAIARRLAVGEQTILFLNRRGFAQFVLCRDCGYVVQCKQCSVSMTYHAARSVLLCHHCGEIMPPPMVCPQCRGPRLRGFGLGTERVEQEVQRLFPSARLARMDRDTTQRKGSHGAILHRVRTGQADILIGTQMVAKGFDFPRLTLVGVISADTGLNIPDFRAAERTFQTLTQVAGRAGRGDVPGEVYVQAFAPNHYAIECAARQDYCGFFENEIAQRKELRYPPFSCLANVVATAVEEHQAITASQEVSVVLRSLAADGLEVLGPSPSPIVRLKGKYRWHVVLRGDTHEQVADACRTALERVRSSVRSLLTVDVDPSALI